LFRGEGGGVGLVLRGGGLGGLSWLVLQLGGKGLVIGRGYVVVILLMVGLGGGCGEGGGVVEGDVAD